MSGSGRPVEHDIPRHGGAGVSFFGAEFKDSWILLASLLLGLLAGRLSAFLYLVVPGAGLLLNREYLQWLAAGPPGRLRLWLYELGLHGYGRGHRSPDTVMVGDARGLNPGSSELLDALEAATRGRLAGGAGRPDDLRARPVRPDHPPLRTVQEGPGDGA